MYDDIFLNEEGIDPYELQKLELRNRMSVPRPTHGGWVANNVSDLQRMEAQRQLGNIIDMQRATDRKRQLAAQQQADSRINTDQGYIGMNGIAPDTFDRDKAYEANIFDRDKAYEQALYDRSQAEAAARRDRLRSKELDYKKALSGINQNAMAAAMEQADAYKMAGRQRQMAMEDIANASRRDMEQNIRLSQRGTEANLEAIKAARDFSTNAMQKSVNTAKSMLTPWRTAGIDAMNKLQSGISSGAGDLTRDAGYKFRLAEGQRAIDNSTAARGMSLSGAALKEALRHNQGFASNEYDKHHARYMDKMGLYQNLSNAGLGAATTMGNYDISGGQAIGGYGMEAGRLTSNAMQAGIDRESGMRERGSNLQGEYAERGAGYGAGGLESYADIIAAGKKGVTNRMSGYEAWKAGNI